MEKKVQANAQFGRWTVLSEYEKTPKGERKWLCHCECGKTCEFPGTLLVTGRRTRCSGKAHEKNYVYTDITGRRFGHLTAQYRTKRESDDHSVVWHCVCDCGNEIDITYNNLVYSNQRSCGCRKREHDRELRHFQTRVDGTSLDIIRSRKIPADNTTGTRGVYLIKGKWVARIVFQKKAYYLGTFLNMADAITARKDAEESVYQASIAFYEKWQQKAERDMEWAEQNPVQIFVNRVNGNLVTSFLPDL